MLGWLNQPPDVGVVLRDVLALVRASVRFQENAIDKNFFLAVNVNIIGL